MFFGDPAIERLCVSGDRVSENIVIVSSFVCLDDYECILVQLIVPFVTAPNRFDFVIFVVADANVPNVINLPITLIFLVIIASNFVLNLTYSAIGQQLGQIHVIGLRLRTTQN